MSGSRAEIAKAEATAVAAKARLRETIARLKSRLDPRVRAQETWEDIRETGEAAADDALELVYERPRAVAGVAGGIGLLLLRKPLLRLGRRLAGWLRPSPPRPTPTPSKIRRKPPAGAPIPLPDQSGE